MTRVTEDRREAEAWSLVLSSQEIDHEKRFAGGVWSVAAVDAGESRRAEAAIDAYVAENADLFRRRPWREAGSTGLGAVWALAIAGAHIVTTQAGSTTELYARGRGLAGAIVSGEPWRAITALTLHVDVSHALGNALSAAVLLSFAGRTLGPGWATAIAIGAGASANFARAHWVDGAFAAIGASTAIFAALGSLAGVQFARPGRGLAPRWAPLAAAAALVAFLGTGERADVAGHALGAAFGCLAGAVLARLSPLGAPVRGQRAAATAALACIVGAWWLALGAPQP